MTVASITKAISVIFPVLHLLSTVVSSASDSKSQNELVDNLKKNGIVTSLDIERVMRDVDRKFFVASGPYENRSHRLSHGGIISAPYVDAYVLEGLRQNLKVHAKVLCIGCTGGYLLACTAILVESKGSVTGIEVNQQLTTINVENVNNWIAKSDKAKTLGLKLEAPFTFLTGKKPEHQGIDKSTIEALKKLLKVGGHFVHMRRTAEGDVELVKLIRLKGTEFYEVILARLPSDVPTKEEKPTEEELPTDYDILDFDELLLASIQIKHIPDIKVVLLLLVCTVTISFIRLF
uniref:protein-L-isoaspartate(D-aspartate) O-methyltransferase n=1 Tax=Trichobilharzia regenti TaxID=157069 RepID=A0AA85J075_TRIRE|nr:unnamed protein product [Trichobilharzia regenti]